MQVNNQAITSQMMTHDKPLELKQGEIYRATIKERTSDNEATLQIRGREISVKFEGRIPSEDRVTVQINHQSERQVQVKVISEGSRVETGTVNRQTEVANTQQALRSLGVTNPSKELQQAAQIILDKGIPLNKESVQDLRNFIEKEKGTIEQRLNTVQAIANKRLEVTTNHLRSVNEALNGRPLNEVLTNIAKELDPNFQVKSSQAEVRLERPVSEHVREVREQVQREANVQRAVEQVRNEFISINRPQGELKPSDQLKQMQGTVQKESDFQKAVTLLNNQIEKSLFEQPIKDLLQKSISEAANLQSAGRELAARQLLMKTFAGVEPQVNKMDAQVQSEVQQYLINENFQTQQLSSKDFLVRAVTEKLANAQSEFKNLQREISRNLDNIQRLNEAFKSQAISQVKPLLETTIKKLDYAILKSEMMLLTDMSTEKKLMLASGQLADAKRLLSKGNYSEANKIVQEVKSLIEKLEFKPSESKVQHFITKEELSFTSRNGSHLLLQQYDEMTRRTAIQEPSARQAFEMVRGLGLNRDSEIAQVLASGKQSQGDGEPNPNMKQALLQVMKLEEEQGRVSQQTTQALANITGQQLLSKSDNNNLQSMFLNLPILLQDEVKNLQVFVNSRNEGQHVDWENCNLYFLIETKKLGEVGILVSATDRNLSLTIKNDKPFFKERIEPLADVCKEKLKEVGYNITSLNFTKLKHIQRSQDEKTNEQSERMTPTFTEKGFDFKI
ncbi:hypothetical protein DS745_15180 [Anaerobacillus alkaliphilus]|uniref:Flagellar hook-length control protein FliK n=1 Tax=Anaerobacillus alkaliphilus TaxID=1548597 RepID=A0A4Q0VRP6_9BACI|nr:hypothetical protein [Anaerobacillus alkaliphilus]RXI99553.1 hypothetical protein DS745_15180 [Anaerobacillus alkaliphilus]